MSEAAAYNRGFEEGKRECRHHPEAMTAKAVDAIVNTTRIEAHQGGVAAGRRLEQDKIGQELILMAQEYGHAQFVFTSEDLETLFGQVAEIQQKLADIQTLR